MGRIADTLRERMSDESEEALEADMERIKEFAVLSFKPGASVYYKGRLYHIHFDEQECEIGVTCVTDFTEHGKPVGMAISLLDIIEVAEEKFVEFREESLEDEESEDEESDSGS